MQLSFLRAMESLLPCVSWFPMRVMLASLAGMMRRAGFLIAILDLLVFLDALLELFVNGLVSVEVVAEGVAEEVLLGLAARHLNVEAAGVVLFKLVNRLLEAEGVGDDAGEQDWVENV